MAKWPLCCIIFFNNFKPLHAVLLAIAELLISNLHTAASHILTFSLAFLYLKFLQVVEMACLTATSHISLYYKDGGMKFALLSSESRQSATVDELRCL